MTRAITELTTHDVIAALGLLEGAAVNQRIPKNYWLKMALQQPPTVG